MKQLSRSQSLFELRCLSLQGQNLKLKILLLLWGFMAWLSWIIWKDDREYAIKVIGDLCVLATAAEQLARDGSAVAADRLNMSLDRGGVGEGSSSGALRQTSDAPEVEVEMVKR